MVLAICGGVVHVAPAEANGILGPSTIILNPITATFVPAEFATHYTVVAKDTTGRPLKFAWSLVLQLVDPTRSSDPANLGSHAAVDLGCNNHHKLTSTATFFVWQHGEGQYGTCDHSKMGPSGHQGKIKLMVSDGKWTCTALYIGTNTGIGHASTCRKLAPAPTKSYSCAGPQLKLFDNTNGGGVTNGAIGPTFSTKGIAYCVTQIDTYHWNGGKGSTPGTVGLESSGGVVLGPFVAKGSAGQGGSPNVNWTASVATSPTPTVISGTYSCTDSNSGTWSQNGASKSQGFCSIYVQKATVRSSSRSKQPSTTTSTTTSKSPACKSGKLAIVASPTTGRAPLAVTFALCSPKVVQWRIDFGDGKSMVATGSPPKLIAHAYGRAGDYRPRLTTIDSPSATTSSSVTTSVSVGIAALIGFTANPASGSSPLKVTFYLSTTVANITTWTVDFGDGGRRSGSGHPPVSVTDTFSKDGSYRATFSVKPGQYALVYTVATITVGTGTPAVLSLSATPTSGSHPFHVTFSLGTTIAGQIVSWVLLFGDGSRQSGSGHPPTTLAHSYTRAGVYGAVLQVLQQQKYGGVLYEVPRGGLPVVVH